MLSYLHPLGKWVGPRAASSCGIRRKVQPFCAVFVESKQRGSRRYSGFSSGLFPQKRHIPRGVLLFKAALAWQEKKKLLNSAIWGVLSGYRLRSLPWLSSEAGNLDVVLFFFFVSWMRFNLCFCKAWIDLVFLPLFFFFPCCDGNLPFLFFFVSSLH